MMKTVQHKCAIQYSYSIPLLQIFTEYPSNCGSIVEGDGGYPVVI